MWEAVVDKEYFIGVHIVLVVKNAWSILRKLQLLMGWKLLEQNAEPDEAFIESGTFFYFLNWIWRNPLMLVLWAIPFISFSSNWKNQWHNHKKHTWSTFSVKVQLCPILGSLLEEISSPISRNYSHHIIIIFSHQASHFKDLMVIHQKASYSTFVKEWVLHTF